MTQPHENTAKTAFFVFMSVAPYVPMRPSHDGAGSD